MRTQGIVRFCTSSVTYSTFWSMCQWMPRVAFSRAVPVPVCTISLERTSVFFSSGSKWILVRIVSSWSTDGQWQPSHESRAGRSVVPASGRL